MGLQEDKDWRDWQQRDRVRRQGQHGMSGRMPPDKKTPSKLMWGMSTPWVIVVGVLTAAVGFLVLLIARSGS